MPLAKYERRALKEKVRRMKSSENKSKMTNYAVISLIVVLVGFLGFSFTGYSVGKENHDGLAKCLSDKDAKFYGAYWCPNCEKQKSLFGSSAQYLNYIECDSDGKNPQPFLCIDKGIKGYPTWEMGGKQYLGIQSLEKLAELSGCKV